MYTLIYVMLRRLTIATLSCKRIALEILNKIENLLGPPNGCFSVSESMRVTDLLTDLQG